MGVGGLTTFLDNNPSLLTDKKLHNQRILIDGSNLFFFLYSYFTVPHEFSGDYETYSSKVRYFFETLISCGIEAYVILDGNCDDKKLPTKLMRIKDQISKSRRYIQTARCTILPLLSSDTFKATLRDLGVGLAVCDNEADEEIAALALKWKCPVLTNDSDFFVYNLPAGVILLDYFNLEVKTAPDGQNYLDAQMFFVDHLLSKFNGIDYSLWPLFATLKGNDYVYGRTLEPFFNGMSKKGKLPKNLSSRNEKIVSILSWLQHAGSFDEALSRVLCRFKHEKRAHVSSLIMQSVNTYVNLSTDLDVFLDGATEIPSGLRSAKLRPLPQWFIHGFRSGDIPTFLCDACVNRRVILTPLIENYSLKNSHCITENIRHWMYAMVTSIDSDDVKTITEHSRHERSLKKFLITVKSDPSLPSLSTLPQLDVKKRQQLLLQVLEMDETILQDVDPDLKLIITCLVYWCQNSDPKITDIQFISMLACVVKVYFNIEATDVDFLKLEIRPEINRKNTLDVSIVHALSQFNVCVRDISALNNLLCKPWPTPDPGRFINGTLVYNLYHDLSTKSHPRQHIIELFVEGSSLADKFRTFDAAIKSALTGECLNTVRKSVSSKTRRSKGRAVVAKECTPSPSDDSDNDADVKLCDVNNRFYQLALAE